jgi:hypothetical protein
MTHVWTPRRTSFERSADQARCRASVWKQDGNWGRSHQCERKPACTRVVDGKEYGFCKQHDPVAVKARSDARMAEYRRESEARNREYDRQKQERAAMDACKAAIEQIAAGHNDPRTLAVKTLKLFP